MIMSCYDVTVSTVVKHCPLADCAFLLGWDTYLALHYTYENRLCHSRRNCNVLNGDRIQLRVQNYFLSSIKVLP